MASLKSGFKKHRKRKKRYQDVSTVDLDTAVDVRLEDNSLVGVAR